MRIVALATFFSLATSRGTRSDEIYREKKMLQYANTILEIIRSDVHKAEPSIAAQINAAIESGSSVSVKILTDQFLESADPAKNVDRDEAIAISYARLQEAMTDFNSLMEADRAWRKQLQRNGPEKWSGQVQQSVWRLQRTMRPLRHSNVNAGATWDQNVAGGYYGTRLFVPVLTNDATIYAKYSFVATIGFEAKAIAKEVSIVVDSSVESGGSAAVEPTPDTSVESGGGAREKKGVGSTNDSDQMCPVSHGYAYGGGYYCCKHNKEKVYAPQGLSCDGSEIETVSSGCCLGDEYVLCPSPPCRSRGGSKTARSAEVKEDGSSSGVGVGVGIGVAAFFVFVVTIGAVAFWKNSQSTLESRAAQE